MATQVVQRLAFAVGAVFLASIVIFAMISALPGNYATTTLGQSATPHLLAVMTHQLGLNRPAPARYISWLSGLLHGSLGKSYSGVSDWSLIHTRLLNSLALAIAVAIFTVPLAVTLGIVTGLRAGGLFDGAVNAVTLVLVSLPEFVVGLFLAALVGVGLGILPPVSLVPPTSNGFAHPSLLILPASAAAAVTIGFISRMTRAATLEVVDSEYVEAARLRGITGVELVRKYILRNALIPAFTVIGNQIGWMLTGLVAIELVFAYPGLGSLLILAIQDRDAPLIAAISLFITGAFVGVNFLTDTLALVLNPRATARR